MRLSELIERLEEFAAVRDDDPEVMVVHQPNYPLQETVQGVWMAEEGETEEEPNDAEANGFVYVVAGGQHPNQSVSPYGPRDAFYC